MKPLNEYPIETWKNYIVHYKMKPKWGGNTNSRTILAPNKTYARMITKGMLNPCDILKIEEEK